LAQKVYLLPGLANDETVFTYLNLGDAEIVHVPWLQPLPKETIENYAKRFSTFITAPNPIIVGLSFGGMMAIEIGKHISTKKIILLSSAKGRQEIPFYLHWLGKTQLQHIAPPGWLLTPNPLLFWFFDVKKPEHKELFRGILKRTNRKLYKWSGIAILTWQNKTIPPNVVHIHGSADRVLPIRFVKPDYTIQGAGHFAVVTHADRVSVLLQQIIAKL
jgi:pimeloyl-ACP methyl ester carboxylesterase